MPPRKVKGGWKYGDSATFKKKPSAAQIAAIHASQEARKKCKDAKPKKHVTGEDVKFKK